MKIEKSKIISLLIATFNELVKQNEMSSLYIYENNEKTWSFFETTNTKRELVETKLSETYDNKKPYFNLELDTYANSMSEEEVIEFIGEVLDNNNLID
jgi:hypothetical protein